MKATNLILTLFLVVSLAACSESENDSLMSATSFEQMQVLYGLEKSGITAQEFNSTPLVTTAEMQSVLETIRKNKSVERACTSSIVEESVNGQTETIKNIFINVWEQQFTMNTTQSFILDKGVYYYLGMDNNYQSDYFVWEQQGKSTYSKGNKMLFEIESCLLFRLSDGERCGIKVPLICVGNCVPETGNGTFTLRLAKN